MTEAQHAEARKLEVTGHPRRYTMSDVPVGTLITDEAPKPRPRYWYAMQINDARYEYGADTMAELKQLIEWDRERKR